MVEQTTEPQHCPQCGEPLTYDASWNALACLADSFAVSL